MGPSQGATPVIKIKPNAVRVAPLAIVYRQHPDIAAGLVRLADEFYSPVASWHHYFSMAKSNFRGYLKGERIRTKKYLYVLRPVLACQWIEANEGPPPMAFEILLDTLMPAGAVRDAIDALLEKKRASAEVQEGPRIAELSDFLESEIERMQSSRIQLAAGFAEQSILDDFLRKVLASATT